MKRTTSFLAALFTFLLLFFVFGYCEAKDGKFGKGSSPGEKKTLTVNDVEYTFCWCPPGEFTMGSPEKEKVEQFLSDGHEDNEVQHKVKITYGFWLLETEVTQKMWTSVMGTTVQDQHNSFWSENFLVGVGDHFPMYYVSWKESQEFCSKLSELSEETITLPTEAQWEYACRAGTDTAVYAGKKYNDSSLDPIAWFKGNSSSGYTGGEVEEGYDLEKGFVCRDFVKREYGGGVFGTHVVKGKEPNAWGLYDMLGNVWEWCSDEFDEAYYASSPLADPKGPSVGWGRVIRGGGWNSNAQDCRSAKRDNRRKGRRDNDLGFRLALVPAEE